MLDTLGIGASLREARIRHGLTLEQVESATRIRPRYLEAVEDERWDELPADAYAKGFLRTYAAFLELDPQQYLAAFRARRREVEEPIAPHPEPPYQPSRPGTRTFAGVAAGLLVVLALGAWQLTGDGESAKPGVAAPAAARAPVAEPAAAKPVVVAPVRKPLLLSAIDDAWLEIRFRTSTGKLVWTGTLRRGRTLRLGLTTPLWIEAGRPAAVKAAIGARAIPVPESTALVATAKGIRAA